MDETQLERPLRTAVAFLDKHEYRYAIIGGIALSRWGIVRATYDVDIKVLVPDTNYDAIRTALRTAFPKRARPGIPENPLIVDVMVGDVIVDFLLAIPGYEELIIERAAEASFGDWSAWICSAEDLIIQKAVSGRGKDWLDVQALLVEQYGKLEQAYVEEWLTQFSAALENPDILITYQRLLARAKALH